MKKHIIADLINYSIYAIYSSEAIALRALTNAIEKGWRIDGRKYNINTLERLSVVSLEAFHAADDLVETYNSQNPDGGVVMIKRSLKGTHMDPATESYHCQ